MIDKLEKKDCNGCKLCKNICPKNAIGYECDIEGFWFPKVDYSKCINCGLCLKKCPNITPIKERTKNPKVYAAWSVDDDVRLASTSGGIFYELACEVLRNNGFVVGCIYNEDFKGAKQVLIENIQDLKPLMVSKYVQSDTEDIYVKTKEKLEAGQTGLFVGAPCHAAALVSYLGKEYDNLIICDFLCRGANSPKAHKKYIEYLEKKYDSRIVCLRSKDKRNGWNCFGQSAIFENGKEYFASREKDLRILAYHRGNLMMRESCHYCKFKHIPRDGADITMADFWGIAPEDVDKIEKGISLVLVNTDNGRKFFNKLQGRRIHTIEKSLEDALKGNSAIYESATRGVSRDKFLSQLDYTPFDKLVKKYMTRRQNIIARLLKKIIKIVKKVVC